jgi:hypothetical protein
MNHSKNLARHLLMGLALLLPSTPICRGADFQFTIPRFDFAEPNKVFDYDAPLIITIRGFQQERHPNLRARLFHGTKASLPNRPYARVGGKATSQCFVYDLEPLEVTVTSTGVDLGYVPQTRSAERHWVVVLEEGEWTHGPIKVLRSAVEASFKSGYEFEVRQPAEEFEASTVRTHHRRSLPTRAEEEARAAASNEVVAAAKKDKVCIHFNSRSDHTLVAQIADCEECRDSQQAAKERVEGEASPRPWELVLPALRAALR